VRGRRPTQTDKKDLQICALAGHDWSSGSAYAMASTRTGLRKWATARPVMAQVRLFRSHIADEAAERASRPGGPPSATSPSIDASPLPAAIGRGSSSILDHPADRRAFKDKTEGSSIYSGAHWHGGRFLHHLDLTIDYHLNQPTRVGRMGRPPCTQMDVNTLFVAELRGQTTLATRRPGRLRGRRPAVPQGESSHRREHLLSSSPQTAAAREVKQSSSASQNVPIVGAEAGRCR